MTPLSESPDTPPTAASSNDVSSVNYTSVSNELHASSSCRDAPQTIPKRSSSLPKDTKVTTLNNNDEDGRAMLQASRFLQRRRGAPHAHGHDLQEGFSPQPEEAYKSQMRNTTMPNMETTLLSKNSHRLTSIDTSGRVADCAGVESPTTPRSSNFVKAAGNMPTSSTVQLQLWESVPSSSSNTLVGIPGHIREHLRGHSKTPSDGSIAQESKRSSFSREGNGHDEREEIPRHLTPTSGTGQPEVDKAAPASSSSLPPVRYAPWADQNRPRSGSTIYFQPDLPGIRQHRDLHSSMPQLSPIMPLVFQPDLPLAILRYTNRIARLLYFIYPLLYFAHVPLTLLLDVNVLYALVQIALHPTAVTYTGDGDNMQGKPRVNPRWIVVALYALSTFFWFFVVFLLHDLYYCHFKVWNNRNPPIMQVFSSAASFHLSCTRSYNLFCSLWRLRFGAFIGIGSLPPSRRQGMLETSHLLTQNWQTVITLVPRAFISLLLLLSFNTTSSSANFANFGRDDAYFRADGTLTTYSIVFNLVSVLTLVAGIIYLRLSRDVSVSVNQPRPSTPGDSYTIVSATSPARMQHFHDTPQEWKRNLRERIIELVLLCSSANRWRTPRDDSNAYKQSRSTRYAAARGRRKRKSSVSFQSNARDVSEMQERPLSNLSFNVHLPGPAASISNNESTQVDEAGREIRISSIPTRRRKKTVSTDSNASSIFSTRVDTSDSSHTVMERPFSALGHNGEQEHRYLLHSRTQSGASLCRTPIAEVFDEEELERLEWEKLAPLTPRGSLMQAREELAQQQKERSYWNAGSTTTPSALSFLEELPTTPADVGHTVERDLHAIVEESDEEASLRRANSLGNRQSVSSRQSSLRRAPTPLNRLDDAGISVIEERSEHGQVVSVG